MKLKYLKFLFCIVLCSGLLPSCKKGELVVKETYVKFRLDVFFTDTSSHYKVQLGDVVLAEKDSAINGSYTTLVNIPEGMPITDNVVKLSVTIQKKNGAAFAFDSTLVLASINDFLLLQLSASDEPILINKVTEAGSLTPPGNDSIKVRFFFNEADGITNSLNNFSPVTKLSLQLYRLDYSSDPIVPIKDQLIENISINQLSEYTAINSRFYLYGFTLIDAGPALPESKKIFQRAFFNIDKSDNFLRGQVQTTAPFSGGNFQTLRISKSELFDYDGKSYKSFNGVFLFGAK